MRETLKDICVNDSKSHTDLQGVAFQDYRELRIAEAYSCGQWPLEKRNKIT